MLGKDADPYGRLVARVTLDGKDASTSILGAGLGCTFHCYVIDRELDMVLTRAREGHLGFCASGAHQPCASRANQDLSPRGDRSEDFSTPRPLEVRDSRDMMLPGGRIARDSAGVTAALR